MPLCVLLWIIVLIPVVMVGWCIFASVTNMDTEPGLIVLIWLGILLATTVPNLLWYKAVRDVMLPDQNGVTLEQPVEKPAPVTVEAPAVFHPELMVQ